MSVTRSVQNAVRQVSRWIVLSRCPLPAEGFFAAGRTIAASNKNRLASRIEADRCNQRTSINAIGIEVRWCAAVGNNSLGGVAISEYFKREISGGDMGVDGDGAPNDFVFARLQLGKRSSQRGRIRLIYFHVTLIDLPPGGIEYLDLTQG